MPTGKTTKPAAAASVPFRAADHLRTNAEIAAYIESILEDGDARVVPIALRTVAEALGGMAALAERTGLSRETLQTRYSCDDSRRVRFAFGSSAGACWPPAR
jgi:probable addiction module antidote protein